MDPTLPHPLPKAPELQLPAMHALTCLDVRVEFDATLRMELWRLPALQDLTLGGEPGFEILPLGAAANP